MFRLDLAELDSRILALAEIRHGSRIDLPTADVVAPAFVLEDLVDSGLGVGAGGRLARVLFAFVYWLFVKGDGVTTFVGQKPGKPLLFKRIRTEVGSEGYLAVQAHGSAGRVLVPCPRVAPKLLGSEPPYRTFGEARAALRSATGATVKSCG